MKSFAKPLMIAAALFGAAAPAMAAPAANNNVFASLSADDAARAGTVTDHDSELAGFSENRRYVFVVIGAILILAIVLIATNDTPTSP